jgi:single-strand DNA-binding protein
MNQIILTGRLVREVDLRISGGGIAIAKFTIAVDKGLYGDKKQEAINQGKQTADFLQVTIFNKQAENAANYLGKGSKCMVIGRLVNANYEKDGQTVYKNDIIADKVEFLDSKQQARHQEEFPDDDIFEPVTDEEIPF